jgi:acetyl-CoA carboxylase biotin carboxyl carrier protein
MVINEIKELIQMLEKSTLTKLQLKTSEFEVTIEKQSLLQTPAASEELIQRVTNEPVSDLIVDNVINQNVPQSNCKEIKTNITLVKTPLIGVFYEAGSPEALPFVTVGQTVKEGDTVCIIEAMKILNEIKAPASGVIKQIHVNNGDIVEFDQVLMEIE